MQFKKILCVTKTTCYQTCPITPASLPKFKRDRLHKEHLYHQHAIEKAKQQAIKYNLNITFIADQDLTQLVCKKYDLVLTLGGDGTFLTTAHYTKDTPILGINSHPVIAGSRGALLSTTVTKIPQLFNALKNCSLKFSLIRFPRLIATLDQKPLPSSALNEIFFGPTEQDKTLEFKITIQNQKVQKVNQSQRANQSQIVLSSGAIICTSRGSTGWYTNAGGKPFEKSLGIGVLIREPNPTHSLTFSQMIIPSSSTTTLEWGGQEGFISFDSRREGRYHTDNKRHILTISSSTKEGLWVVKI